MSKKPFSRFIQQEEKGARKKERIRQEKKQQRAETKAYFEQKKAASRGGRWNEKGKEVRSRDEKEKVKGNEKFLGSRNVYEKGKEIRSRDEKVKGNEKEKFIGSRNVYEKGKEIRSRDEKGKEIRSRDEKVKGKEKEKFLGSRNVYEKGKEIRSRDENAKGIEKEKFIGNRNVYEKGKVAGKVFLKSKGKETPREVKQSSQMPLNKFIAHCGACSRREAADWVKSGKVTVNNNRIVEPGHKVSPSDEVRVNGKTVLLRRNLVYILLNKPKDCITTTDDPNGRTTVLDLIKSATTERVYPVGRLDRNTTGVLLLTNDGELTQKLAHPRFEVKKIYEVTLDKPLTSKDFDSIARGITLEDGFIAPDALAWPLPGNKQVVGIEIHSGRNRIVRRIFEHLGYDIKGLDRVLYGNLSKKNVERGRWRFLSEKEVRLLKYLNTSYKKPTERK